MLRFTAARRGVGTPSTFGLFALGAALSLGLMLSVVGSARAAAVPVKVNFQPASSVVPSGYSVDSGAAYSDTRGYGWVRQDSLAGSHVPLDLSPNTRERNLDPDLFRRP